MRRKRFKSIVHQLPMIFIGYRMNVMDLHELGSGLLEVDLLKKTVVHGGKSVQLDNLPSAVRYMLDWFWRELEKNNIAASDIDRARFNADMTMKGLTQEADGAWTLTLDLHYKVLVESESDIYENELEFKDLELP